MAASPGCRETSRRNSAFQDNALELVNAVCHVPEFYLPQPASLAAVFFCGDYEKHGWSRIGQRLSPHGCTIWGRTGLFHRSGGERGHGIRRPLPALRGSLPVWQFPYLLSDHGGLSGGILCGLHPGKTTDGKKAEWAFESWKESGLQEASGTETSALKRFFRHHPISGRTAKRSTAGVPDGTGGCRPTPLQSAWRQKSSQIPEWAAMRAVRLPDLPGRQDQGYPQERQGRGSSPVPGMKQQIFRKTGKRSAPQIEAWLLPRLP